MLVRTFTYFEGIDYEGKCGNRQLIVCHRDSPYLYQGFGEWGYDKAVSLLALLDKIPYFLLKSYLIVLSIRDKERNLKSNVMQPNS